MRLKSILLTITEFKLADNHGGDYNPVISQAKNRDRVQELFFYSLPKIIQNAVLADMTYDDFAKAKIWSGAYFVKTKDGQEFGYNPDGTRWEPDFGE